MKTRKADGRLFGQWEAQVFMRDFAGEMRERCAEWCFCLEAGPEGGLRGVVEVGGGGGGGVREVEGA